MKCPKCGINHKKKEGYLCTCGHKFCFRPDVDGGMTDGKFVACIRRASANDTYYFTEDQLYTAWCRQAKGMSSPAMSCGCCLTVGIAIALATHAGTELIPFRAFVGLFAVFVGLVAFVFLIRLIWRAVGPPPDEVRFREAVRKWVGVQGPIEKMIETPRLGTPPPEFEEPDLYDYGVERILVVQHDLLVDLFVLNGLHAEHRMLVVSANGYPEYLRDRAQQLLVEALDLPVLLLHDSTPEGVTMGELGVRWLAARNVIDLGLEPDDVPRLKSLRATKPKRRNYEVAVASIPYVSLSSLLGNAIAEGVAIAEVLPAVGPGYGDGGMGFG